MIPAGRLAPQPWMTQPETQRVIDALTAGGATVRFVGGCVRDALLGRAVVDVDLTGPEPPEVMTRRLEAAGIRAIPTGIAHGTITAVIGERHFEVTTLRRDVETFGRHARVVFTDDWAADAARRDFTVNALYADPDGTLYDPTGGMADLRAGRIRFVGEPERRIAEDALRILRFFRFHAHYGAAAPDGAARAACRAGRAALRRLSAERIAGEILRLLGAVQPAPVIAVMIDDGVLAEVLPEAVAPAPLARLVALEAAAAIPLAPLRRLAALLSPTLSADAAETVARRLRLSGAQRDHLAALFADGAAPGPDDDAPTRRRMLYRIGAERYRDRALIAWARKAQGADDALAAALAAAAAWQAPTLPVRGRDVTALGIPRGPAVGALLRRVEAWWIAGDFQADRDATLAALRACAATVPDA